MCIRATARENAWHVSLSDQWVSPFAWETRGPLPFVWMTSGSLSSLEQLAGLFLRLKDQRTSPLRLNDQWISPFAWETSGPIPFAWETSVPLSLAWETSESVPSVQIYRPYIVFSSPMRKYEHPLSLTCFSFCDWLSELKYFLFSSYLLILSANGNIFYSIHRQYIIFSFLWNNFVDVILRLHWICQVHRRQLS